MLRCTACGGGEVEGGKCAACGALVIAEIAWGTVEISAEAPAESGLNRLATESGLKAKVKLKPLEIDDRDQFEEEITEAGDEIFPRLGTDAIVDTGELDTGGLSPGDGIMDLTDGMRTDIPRTAKSEAPNRVKTEVPAAATEEAGNAPADKCENCDAPMDFLKSRICDACGVRAAKRPEQRTAKPRSASRYLLRCRLCGYTVDGDSQACVNCGTPVES